MGTNSVITNLDKGDMISEIRLLSGDPEYRKKVFVVVEGQDDIKLLQKILNEQVVLCESYSGKCGVSEIVCGFFEDNKRIVGIRDQDYELTSIHPKILYYDYCCMEMMIVANINAFASVFYEYAIPNTSPDELKVFLLTQLYGLSLIRSYNERGRCSLNLCGISFSKSLVNGIIVYENIIHQIAERNGDKLEIYKDSILRLVQESRCFPDYIELLRITNGHDFSALYAILYSQRRAGISGKDIEASLRCSYRKQDFVETTLYEKIVAYEQAYQLNIV